MGTFVKRSHRSGISLPEVIGLMACLAAGLLVGCWLFFEEEAKVAALDAAHAKSSLTPAEVATSAPVLTKEEAELHKIQQDIINDINAAQKSHPAPNEAEKGDAQIDAQDINAASVQALLGEDQSTTSDVTPTAKHAATEQRTTQPVGLATNERSPGTATGPQTLAYWNAMNNVMAEEESMRAAPAGGVTKENAADFIARRGEAGNYAATELRGLDRTGVDLAVVALGGEIATWYEQGTQLNDKASYLLNQASDQTRQGQTGRSWGNSEKAHSASVAKINRRGDALRVEMSKKYGLKFPDLR